MHQRRFIYAELSAQTASEMASAPGQEKDYKADCKGYCWGATRDALECLIASIQDGEPGRLSFFLLAVLKPKPM